MKDLLLKLTILLVLAAALVFQSCKSYEPEMLLRGVNENDTEEWRITLDSQDEGGHIFRMTGPALDQSEMEGEAFLREDGTWLIHLDYLHWFYNHPLGWTDGDLSLWGSLVLEPRGDQWIVKVEEKPWLESVVASDIRYRDPIVTGDQGRDRLQRRWTRIQELNSLWQEKLPENHYVTLQNRRRDRDLPSFSKAYKELLFPELYGYPQDWSDDSGENWSLAEDIRWNRDYSAHLLPEEWTELRDSGTLLRDFEEAASLIWINYNWDWLWDEEIPGTSFQLEITE